MYGKEFFPEFSLISVERIRENHHQNAPVIILFQTRSTNEAKFEKKEYLYCGFPDGSTGKEPEGNVDLDSIPGSGRSSGQGMATHSNNLPWEIPWTEEPSRLQFMGLQESDMTQQVNHHHKWSITCKIMNQCFTCEIYMMYINYIQ